MTPVSCIRVSVSDTPIHLCAFNFCRNLTYPRIRILPIPIRVSVSMLHSFLHPISFTTLLVPFKSFIIWIQGTQGPITFWSQPINSRCIFGYISISITRLEILYITTWLIFLVCITLFSLVCLTPLPVLFVSLLIPSVMVAQRTRCRSRRSWRASSAKPGS